jgi:hypothetical protein
LSLRHGAYANVRLGPRVEELADELRELVPVYCACDAVAVHLLALTISRLEASAVALEGAEPSELSRLQQDTRGWVNSAGRLLDALGMTPTARARLGVDVARVAAAREASLEQLQEAGRLAREGAQA